MVSILLAVAVLLQIVQTAGLLLEAITDGDQDQRWAYFFWSIISGAVLGALIYTIRAGVPW